MTIFDLIFIAVFLTTVITLVTAAIVAIFSRRHRAFVILRTWGAGIVLYLVVVVVVSVASPQRVLGLNEPQCFDDWCISVDHAKRVQSGENDIYEVTLNLFSRALRRPQRENGLSVYILDDSGNRYYPEGGDGGAPYNVLLGPGESVQATRRFTLPAGVEHPSLVVADGRFPGMFIITDNESLLHKPTIVRLF